jgi:hypothetical protein
LDDTSPFPLVMRFGIVYGPPMDSSKEQYHVEGIHYREVGPKLTL